jgi:hypothetical protein
MTDFMLDMAWFRCPDGYRLLQSSEDGSKKDPHERILANSFAVITYWPFAKYDMLWSAFAEVKNAGDLLAFVQSFGGLELWNVYATEAQDLRRALKFAQEFRDLLQAKERSPKKVARVFRSWRLAELQARFYKERGDMIEARAHVELAQQVDVRLPLFVGDVSVEDDEAEGIRITIKPNSLISGLWLQLARKLSGRASMRTCRYCGSLFEAGPGALRRADATFCCSEHSVRFHSLKRSKGK